MCHACTHTNLTVSGSDNRVVGIVDSIDGAPLEDHVVLGQSSCLVSEDVLHLAQLLGDVQGSTFCTSNVG